MRANAADVARRKQSRRLRGRGWPASTVPYAQCGTGLVRARSLASTAAAEARLWPAFSRHSLPALSTHAHLMLWALDAAPAASQCLPARPRRRARTPANVEQRILPISGASPRKKPAAPRSTDLLTRHIRVRRRQRVFLVHHAPLHCQIEQRPRRRALVLTEPKGLSGPGYDAEPHPKAPIALSVTRDRFIPPRFTAPLLACPLQKSPHIHDP